MSDVTLLLGAAAAGDRRAAADLLPLVYDELRVLATARLAAEPEEHTLQPTALVHEAYVRLVGPSQANQQWAGQGHFFAAAAEAMRRILVDHARKRLAAKRGAGRRADVDPDQVPSADPDSDILAVHEALDGLRATEPRMADLVTLRFFGGLTGSEAAETLGVSPRTADAWWAYARAWLGANLSRN